MRPGERASRAAAYERARPEILQHVPRTAGRLQAHRHDGFWACMDTYKDAVTLDDLWAAGDAPWAAGIALPS